LGVPACLITIRGGVLWRSCASTGGSWWFVGLGISDKPAAFDYSIASHAATLAELVEICN
jgi:hypothetical protein